jgi:hypothetical protein
VPQELAVPVVGKTLIPTSIASASHSGPARRSERDVSDAFDELEHGVSDFAQPDSAHERSNAHARSVHERGSERSARPVRKCAAGPLLSGNISGLSLGSLFRLFEFERSSGTLRIHNHDRRLDLALRGGSVVRCELDGVRTSAAIAVREAFTWPLSTFSFERDVEEDDSEPPQSVNALMLEAMRFHDEELRAG